MTMSAKGALVSLLWEVKLIAFIANPRSPSKPKNTKLFIDSFRQSVEVKYF